MHLLYGASHSVQLLQIDSYCWEAPNTHAGLRSQASMQGQSIAAADQEYYCDAHSGATDEMYSFYSSWLTWAKKATKKSALPTE